MTPDKVSVPAFKTKLPVPLITPLKLPLAFERVNCCAPKAALPVPDKLVSVVPFEPLILKVPLFATPLELAILPLPLNTNVPPLILVEPLYVLTPDKVSVPAFKTKLPVPLITPLKFPLALLRVNCWAPRFVLPEPSRLVIVMPFVTLISNVPTAFICELLAIEPLPLRARVAPLLICVGPT